MTGGVEGGGGLETCPETNQIEVGRIKMDLTFVQSSRCGLFKMAFISPLQGGLLGVNIEETFLAVVGITSTRWWGGGSVPQLWKLGILNLIRDMNTKHI